VIDSRNLERDASAKPLHTFAHPTLAVQSGAKDAALSRRKDICHQPDSSCIWQKNKAEFHEPGGNRHPFRNTANMSFRSGPHRRLLIRSAILGFRVLAVMETIVLRPAGAVETPLKPHPSVRVIPLPPVRPPNLSINTPAQEKATGADPSPPAPLASQMADPPAPPRSLPPSSRARMHECGLEWQKMKETGAAASQIWFDFAQLCLTK